MGKKITIVLCIWGKANLEVLDVVLSTIRKQSSEVDIIISEQLLDKSLTMSGEDFAKKYSTKYVRSRAEKCKEGIPFNIGRIRNIAASFCDTEYIYFSDADVIFYDMDYISILEKIIEDNPDAYFKWPPMARVSKDTGIAMIDALKKGIYPAFENREIFSFEDVTDSKDNYYVSYNADDNLLEVSPGYEMRLSEEYSGILGLERGVLDNTMKAAPNYDVHRGGTIIKLTDFWDVGGYGESYYRWGYEDADIQWKLEHVAKCKELRSCFGEYPIIHVEHGFNFDKTAFLYNQKINNQRHFKGVERIISMDKNRDASFTKAFLNNDKELMSKYIIETKDYRR